jgi:hypothetical protein
MRITYLILLLALLAWKGWHAWRRGRNNYRRDRQTYASLWEYQLGNGVSQREVRRPILIQSLQRALLPVVKQWKLWAVVAAIGILIWLLS